MMVIVICALLASAPPAGVSADATAGISTGIDLYVDQEVLSLSGRVVDADGRPAVGVSVGFDWYMTDERLVADSVSVSDENGSFSGIPFTGRPAAIMAVDREQQTGGMVVVLTADDEIIIQLTPLVPVRGRIVCCFFDERPEYSYVSIMVPIPGYLPSTLVHEETGVAASFRILLPPGSYDYNLYTHGIEFRRENGSFTVKSGEDLDLGELDFGVTPIASFYGKYPPDLQATDVEGAEADISYRDYRGRWVLAYYFAYT